MIHASVYNSIEQLANVNSLEADSLPTNRYLKASNIQPSFQTWCFAFIAP